MKENNTRHQDNHDYHLPPALIGRLEEMGIGTDSILFHAESDLDLKQQFGILHLLLTQQSLLLADTNHLIHQWDLSQIRNVHIEELMGASSLVATVDQDEQRLLYFSKTQTPSFATLCRVLNDHQRGLKPEVEDMQNRRFCAKCANPLPEHSSNCPRCVPKGAVLRRLLGLLAPYRARMILVIVATFIGVGAQMAPPYITKRIVDEVIMPANTGPLAWWIIAMLAAGILYLGARWLIGATSAWLSARLISDLRSRLHQHLQHLHLDYFSRRTSGDIVARVMQDTTELQQFLIEGLPYLLVNGISFLAIASILLMLDSQLALIVFLPVPFLIGGVHWIWRRLRPLLYQRNRYRGSLHSILGESILGIKAVKAASSEDDRSQRFNRSNEKFFNALRRIMSLFVGFTEGSFWIMSVGVTIVWYVAASRLAVAHDGLTLGDLLAFAGYIWLFYAPLQWFGVVMNWMNNAFAGAERVFTILDTVPETYDNPNAIQGARIRGEITFRDVHFSYEKGKEVLKDINLHIQPGEMIGLVGRSGAGKSTIINLICRFYDVDSGQLLIDGEPIGQYRLHELRRSIGIVMQEPFIFRGSIRDNIAYSVPHASFEQIVSAARAAHAHEFILDKEFAYDTVIGENGIQLSGGERQRIAIARAILQDPAILILDEATSLVDSETEKTIQEAIDNLVRNRTTIAIAHRLATLRNANRLVVIDKGCIAETGTHDELLQHDGIYATLVRAQSELNRLRTEVCVA